MIRPGYTDDVQAMMKILRLLMSPDDRKKPVNNFKIECNHGQLQDDCAPLFGQYELN